MLYFLQSVLLWTSAGIVIPVIIHLWNVKQGKTLKVGSISLFSESQSSHARSFWLSDVLLLLLRCLLIISLAILVAGPICQKKVSEEEKGWIMIEKNDVKQAYQSYGFMIDSLIRSGYHFHHFDESFEEDKLESILTRNYDTTLESTSSYWALLSLLNEKLPPNFPVYVFASNQLKRFYGNRPETSLRIKWITINNNDTASVWLQKAHQTAEDSIRLIKGESHPFGTRYVHSNLTAGGVEKEVEIGYDNNNSFVLKKDSPYQRITVDTSTVRVVIYTDKFRDDANYLEAAVNAVKEFTQHKILVSVTHDVDQIPNDHNWLFWLSEQNIPASLLKHNVLVYEKGKPEKEASILSPDDNTSLTETENISIYQSIDKDSLSRYQTIWKDAFGDAVLSKHKDEAIIYHCYSRFQPQWNDLVWSSEFPQAILALLFNEDNTSDSTSLHDKRIVASSQIQPLFVPANNQFTKEENVVDKDLSKLFWLAAFILFIVERIFSFRFKKQSYE